MSLDERSSGILTTLIGSSSYVSIHELTAAFHVSKRTVYYDIEKINDWLKANKFPPVHYVRSLGFSLDDESKKRIPESLSTTQQWNYEYSQKERKALLAVSIIGREKKLLLEDLNGLARVSRNTTIEDMKLLKSELESYGVILASQRQNGYFLQGEESDIRKSLMHFLSQLTFDLSWSKGLFTTDAARPEISSTYSLFDVEVVKSIYLSLTIYERLLKVRFADETIGSLSVFYYFLLKRYKQENYATVDVEWKQTVGGTEAYLAAREAVVPVLERFLHSPLLEDEVCYVTMHLLAARLQETQQAGGKPNGSDRMSTVSLKMIEEFERHACVIFQDRTGLEQGLSLHLRSAFHRLRFQIDVPNPLTEQIKEKYRDVFLFAKKVVHHFEREAGCTLDDDAVSFIAMHFGGGMRRESALFRSRPTALVVCAGGVGTSQILKKQLQELFPGIDFIGTMATREYESARPQVDLVFSTHPVSSGGNEVMIVNPLMSEVEKINLLKKVHARLGIQDAVGSSVEGLIKIVRKHAAIRNEQEMYAQIREYMSRPKWSQENVAARPLLDELLVPARIRIADMTEDWQAAIRLSARPLVDDHTVEETYVEAMIHNIVQKGLYIIIAPHVAIPHAEPLSGVNKTGISLLILKQGVAFSEREEHRVHLIFTLAATDNETHLRALSQLTSLLTDEGNIDRLITSETVSGVTQMIKRYSL